MDIKDTITILSVLVALISVFVAVYTNRKSLYINTITSARIKHLESIRNLISDYCSKTISVSTNNADLKSLETLQKLSFLIKLHLDRNHPFDEKIIEKINYISDQLLIVKKSQLLIEINALVELTQDLVLLEWSGIKKETIKGNLDKKSKKKLINKHLKY